MKRLLITALVCLFTLGATSTAKAVVLGPDGFAWTVGNAPTDWGTLITSINLPIDYDNILGEVTQGVFLNDVGYLFAYQFENYNEGSINAIKRMTATDFTGFYTDVDAFLSEEESGEILPLWLDRSTAGDSVGFQFFGPGGTAVGPGSTSAILWIQTNAKLYAAGTAHFINGGTEDIRLYGPAVPEPTSMLLFGMGVLGLIGLGRKKA
ncbi:MAG: PEP-CTERM sorting domain-containing protein [Candidatus Omnitrophica bacterium]|nr:PEP-CTERM sorting domain-containing protein [Candidatus Omnitrophota bacterium]